MADYAEIGGLPFKVSPGQQEDLARSGTGQYNPVDAETAHQGNEAVQDIARAEDRYGTMGAGALGLASGLTLGTGPGVAAALGFLNPNDVGALEGTGAYQAGDVAGMIIPSLLTAGEATGARGLLGSAMRMSPAGMMGEAGSLSERLAMKLLPGAGSIARPAITMAARGATEGALINVGHTIGDSLIQNKPLSAEALWAAGTDGALAGGLMGGGLGLVGGVGKALTERLPGAVSGAAKGLSEKSLSSVAKRLGMSEEQVIEAQSSGTLKETLQNWRRPLDIDNQGVTYGSGSAAIRESAKRAGSISSAVRDGVVETLDKQAPLAVPRLDRVGPALDNELLLPYRGTLAEREAGKWVGTLKKELAALEPLQETGLGKAAAPAEWKKWVETRDQLAERIRTGKYEGGFAGARGMGQKLAEDALRVIDREIESAMRGAAEQIGEKGLAEKFLGAQLDIKYARTLEETVGKKAAKELLAHETTFTPRDISVLGGMAIVGNPGLALGWAAAKGIGRRINRWAEPAMAEAAYQRSIGARAAAAEQKATFTIRDSVRNFFRRTGSTARRTVSSGQAYDRSKPKQKYDRAAYEDAHSRAEQLVSQNHQQRVQELIQALDQQGYGQFAKALFDTNQRAVQYLQMNMPTRRATGAMGSLRATPQVHGLDMKEFKFLRVFNGVTSPFAVLEKLEDGSMARDEVRAMKYVYPELHSQIVMEAAQQIADMKAEGKSMPMDKIAHLGVILDAPIDSMLDSSRINAIQASFIPPEPPPGAAPPPPPQGPMIDPMLQTPIDASMA